jgi:glycosyltransferase involved in cell wall biosynthesis
MTSRRFWIRLRRFLRRRILRENVEARDSAKSRRDLLDEVYLLRDVAGEPLHKFAALQERIEALRQESRVSGRGLPHRGSSPEGAAPESLPDEARDAQPRLYVDITELAHKAGQTGIQRLVRETLRALLADPPGGYRVEAVRAPPGEAYRHARAFARGLRVAEIAGEDDTPIDPRADDVFLGLDHSMYAVIANAGQLAAMRDRGVRLWFVCNDVLPLTHPEWFPPEVHVAFKAWLETIARIADGVACISRTTETELRSQLERLPVSRHRMPILGHFELGADIARSGGADAAAAPGEAATLEHLRGLPSFLMVGTLEPRKGHAQALEAFERLWDEGENVALVLVGLPGWLTDVTQRRIRHHDELGKRLFWFMHADDALVEKLYATCTALLVPSQGEGFGLPLVEAARHGLPVLARDMPVFREVAGTHAVYFSGLDGASLASAVRQWLAAHGRGDAPVTAGMPQVTWSESAARLARLVLDPRPGPGAATPPQGAEPS